MITNMVWEQIIIDWTHLVILTMAVGFLLHEVGMLSLGHSGLILIGAYCAGFWVLGQLSLLSASGLVVLALLALSLTAMRVRDDIFAVVTLGFGELIRLFVVGASDLTGGTLGLGPIPRSDWMASAHGAQWMGGVTVVVLGSAVAVLMRSWPGLILGSIRDGELLSQSCGVATGPIRLVAVSASGLAAVVVGALQATYFGLATPNLGTVDISLYAVASAMLGWPLWRQGRPERALIGFIVGSFVLVALPPFLRQVLRTGLDVAVFRQAVFGAVLYCLVHPRSPLSTVFNRP